MQNAGRDSRKTTGLIALTPSAYTGRFAPSPTGPLHLGSLFTALASYLDARHQGGHWLLRIDDLDTPRIQAGASLAILKCLERFELFWDDEVDYQSRHLAEYAQALEQLIAQQHVYGCRCNRKQLLAMSGPYSGACRELCLPLQADVALRLSCPDSVLSIKDGLQGAVDCNLAREQGDFVIRRKDGLYAYQLAVVVDDYRQGITHVVRGFDLLDSTPRQVYLQQLLGLPQPVYSHVPVIVAADGFKLSKQTQAQAVNLTQPARTLCLLLDLLDQQPPAELQHASVSEILSWAIAHWHIDHLAGQRTIQLPAITL